MSKERPKISEDAKVSMEKSHKTLCTTQMLRLSGEKEHKASIRSDGSHYSMVDNSLSSWRETSSQDNRLQHRLSDTTRKSHKSETGTATLYQHPLPCKLHHSHAGKSPANSVSQA